MIYETILHRGQRLFFSQLPMSENDLANEIVMQVFHWCHPKVCGDFSCRGPSTWEVYMRQGSNPYSLAHSGGPSAEALDFLRTSSPPKKYRTWCFFWGVEDGDSVVENHQVEVPWSMLMFFNDCLGGWSQLLLPVSTDMWRKLRFSSTRSKACRQVRPMASWWESQICLAAQVIAWTIPSYGKCLGNG